jgi:hypothetical protein
MRLIPGSIRRLAEIVSVAAIAGCSSGSPPVDAPSSPGSGGAPMAVAGAGGSSPGGTGGAAGSGGSAGSPDAPGGASGTGGSAAPGTGGGTAADAGGSVVDASEGTPPDARSSFPDSATPMGTDGGPQPSYEGEIPIYYGPEVGPIVKMDCPEDPTAGWTEYQDGFHIERPYNVPINTRFSITGGIYNFWVFPNDRPHSLDAKGRNPRTEATYGGIYDKGNVAGGSGLSGRIGFFTKGLRLYSADMLIEKNAVGSAIMQIHTTAQGGGPIGLRLQGNGALVNNGSLTVANNVPIDKWFNFKASLNADTQEVQIFINNCLTKTYKGDRGDGNFYFKNGVYFCKQSPNGCFSHYKNVHLYKK